jgi:hypothetical protein
MGSALDGMDEVVIFEGTETERAVGEFCFGSGIVVRVGRHGALNVIVIDYWFVLDAAKNARD